MQPRLLVFHQTLKQREGGGAAGGVMGGDDVKAPTERGPYSESRREGGGSHKRVGRWSRPCWQWSGQKGGWQRCRRRSGRRRAPAGDKPLAQVDDGEAEHGSTQEGEEDVAVGGGELDIDAGAGEGADEVSLRKGGSGEEEREAGRRKTMLQKLSWFGGEREERWRASERGRDTAAATVKAGDADVEKVNLEPGVGGRSSVGGVLGRKQPKWVATQISAKG